MRYAYYPGCSLDATGLEYDISTRIIARDLEIELKELPDWSCCGSSPAHNTNHVLALALAARNLVLAEKMGLDMAVPCASCFSRLKFAQKAMEESAQKKKEIEEVIEMNYRGEVKVYNLVDIIANHLEAEKIKNEVVKPLTGIKVASYYGCLLLRPPAVTGFDKTEDPTSMEKIVELLGGESVDWAFKAECCGAGHTTTRRDVAFVLLDRIYTDAQKRGADCIISACPLCMLNLDMREEEVAHLYGKSYNIPIFYFTELMGLAFGHSPQELGLPKHFVNTDSILQKLSEVKEEGGEVA